MATKTPFIPAEDLKKKFGAFGHFYTLDFGSEGAITCRSVLEICQHEQLTSEPSELLRKPPSAVFILMNPGSSKPLVEVDKNTQTEAVGCIPTPLVPAKPDNTQYQVMRLMHSQNWAHARVLNLSDIRSPKSAEFIRMFMRTETDNKLAKHSLFSRTRERELSARLPGNKRTPVILAWGINNKLSPLIERCMKRLPKSQAYFGLLKPGTTNRYRHPLPRRVEDQRFWIEQVAKQLSKA